MKQPLDSESREALVKYRMQRAHETLQDAIREYNHGSYNSSMNRLYYACFYAVLALLVKNGIEAKSQDGVKRMFSLGFIANKTIDEKYGTYYSRIFQARIQGDYDDYFYFDKETSSILISEAEDFIAVIEKAIDAPTP